MSGKPNSRMRRNPHAWTAYRGNDNVRYWNLQTPAGLACVTQPDQSSTYYVSWSETLLDEPAFGTASSLKEAQEMGERAAALAQKSAPPARKRKNPLPANRSWTPEQVAAYDRASLSPWTTGSGTADDSVYFYIKTGRIPKDAAARARLAAAANAAVHSREADSRNAGDLLTTALLKGNPRKRRNPDLSGALTISHEASGDVLIRHVAHNPRKLRRNQDAWDILLRPKHPSEYGGSPLPRERKPRPTAAQKREAEERKRRQAEIEARRNIRSVIRSAVRGVLVGITPTGETVIFRDQDYDGNGHLSGPSQNVDAIHPQAFYVLSEMKWDDDSLMKHYGITRSQRLGLQEVLHRFAGTKSNPARRRAIDKASPKRRRNPRALPAVDVRKWALEDAQYYGSHGRKRDADIQALLVKGYAAGWRRPDERNVPKTPTVIDWRGEELSQRDFEDGFRRGQAAARAERSARMMSADREEATRIGDTFRRTPQVNLKRRRNPTHPEWVQQALKAGASLLEGGEHGFYSVKCGKYWITEADTPEGQLTLGSGDREISVLPEAQAIAWIRQHKRAVAKKAGPLALKRHRNPSVAHAAPNVSPALLARIARMTDENDHPGAYLALARDVLKSPTFTKKMAAINRAQDKAGELTEPLQTKRRALSAKMWAQAKRRLDPGAYALLRRSF